MMSKKEKITTYTSEDIKRMSKLEEYQSDWKEVDSITDEQLDEMIKKRS